jgi:hypothetical protein
MRQLDLSAFHNWRRKNPDLKAGPLTVSPDSRRIGRFKIPHRFVRTKDFQQLLAKMAFVPVRVESLFAEEAIEYVGFSPIFRELEQSELTPAYILLIKPSDDGEILEVLASEESNPF